MKKKRRTIIAYGIALCLFLGGAFPALAVGPGETASLDSAVYERLQDDTAEWDEIQNLVTYYNPTYRLYADSAGTTNEELSAAGDSFKEEMDQNLDAIDQGLKTIREQQQKLASLPGSMVIDGNGTTAEQALTELNRQEASLKQQRETVRQGTGKALSSITGTRLTTEESLKPVREQIAQAVESLFISYEELQINRSLVEKQVSLYKTVLETRQSLQEKEMALPADVAAAKASLSEAENTLTQIDNGLAQLRTAIGLQLGWDAEHAPKLGSVPDPDPAFPDSVDKEADFQKALENNSAYKKTKELKNYKGTAAVSLRDAALNEASAAASAEFDALYAEMQKQKLLYDAAQTSLKRAELTKKQAGKMWDLGLLGNAEYEGKQLEYLSCEASVRLSRLALFSAINEYQWAVRGYMEY